MQFDEASWIELERAAGSTLRGGLERALRGAILDGSLRPGASLPSSRVLASTLGVSRGVTSDAYGQLEAQGLLVVTPRSAPVVARVERLVTARPSRPAPRRSALRLHPHTPDVTLFPRRLFARALADATRAASSADLDYGDAAGSAGLRTALAEHLGLTRGVVADPEQILITQGTAQAIDLVLRVLRRRGLATVGVEDPSLESQQERVRQHGLEVLGNPVDRDGLIVEGLRGDALIVMPAHQFPTGTVLRGDRRRALVEWARAGDRFVIEDDYDAEFRYDRAAVRALQGLDPARVIYTGTTSKTLAPALRIGWIAAPPGSSASSARSRTCSTPARPRCRSSRSRALLRGGEYARHVRRVRSVYRARRDALLDALARELPGLPVEGVAAGMHLLAAAAARARRHRGGRGRRGARPRRRGASRCTRSRRSPAAASCSATAACTRARSRTRCASSRPRSALRSGAAMPDLERYRAKRTRGKTPEPFAASPAAVRRSSWCSGTRRGGCTTTSASSATACC